VVLAYVPECATLMLSANEQAFNVIGMDINRTQHIVVAL